jgi:hypothetical protein
VHKIRVYVDTSVFGGTQDEEFFVESNNFFDHVRLGEYMVLLSDETQREPTSPRQGVKLTGCSPRGMAESSSRFSRTDNH